MNAQQQRADPDFNKQVKRLFFDLDGVSTKTKFTQWCHDYVNYYSNKSSFEEKQNIKMYLITNQLFFKQYFIYMSSSIVGLGERLQFRHFSDSLGCTEKSMFPPLPSTTLRKLLIYTC